MKIKIITYKDKTIGYETDSISVHKTGGVVDTVDEIEENEEIVRSLLLKPDKHEIKNRHIVVKKTK